jgi:formylglycine-generating enzyme required for sulfatase activity
LEFVEDKGYERREFWTEESWQWVVGQTHKLPFNWVQKEKLFYRTITSEIEMPFDWPVMTNNYEAEAFCKWKSTKLNKRVRMISYEEWYLLN